jgi:hypothetical protein
LNVLMAALTSFARLSPLLAVSDPEAPHASLTGAFRQCCRP